MENANFDGPIKEIDSPRSLQACEELGILPEELFYQNFDEFLNNNPDMITLSKDILKKRFNNIDEFRRRSIKEARMKRRQIIIEKSMTVNHSIGNNLANNDNFDFEKDFHEMEIKERKEIEKIKQRQKNQLETEIEVKIKAELLKYKSDMKENLLKEKNDKIKEDRRIKSKMEDKKIKEKEIIRQMILRQKSEEQEKKNREKHEAEEKRLKDIQEMNKKNHMEQVFRQTQKMELIQKRREMIMMKLKEEEIKNREKEKMNIEKEKKRQEQLESQRIERIKYNEMKNEENIKRLNITKMNKELSIERTRKNLDERTKLTQERLNKLMLKKINIFKIQNAKHLKRIEFMKNSLRNTNELTLRRNERIFEHQDHIDKFLSHIGKLKKNKIKERCNSQNLLFKRFNENRQIKNLKLMERCQKIMYKMEQKGKNVSNLRIKRIKSFTTKQESEYIKQYEKRQNIKRLNRINDYKNRKRLDEINEKLKKIEKYKLKKEELRVSKSKLTDSIEREKQKLIEKFETVLQKNKQIDAEVVKELFPEDEDLYQKIKNMTSQIYSKFHTDTNFRNNKKIKYSSAEDSYRNESNEEDITFLTQKMNLSTTKNNKNKINNDVIFENSCGDICNGSNKKDDIIIKVKDN